MDATIAFIMLIEAVLILLAIAISNAIRLIPPLHAILQSSVEDGCKDVVDSIPPVSSASHIIVAPSPLATKYDVFLSFRGEDTRHTFSSYIYEALRGANIKTFMDHKLHKGDDISPILLKTIEESEISLIIFSKNYASSTWCMEELAHIMKCKDQCGRIVIPIFYNIDPSNVRKQNGSFGDGFAKLKLRFKHELEKLEEWTKALIQSTNLSGWDSKNIRPESELIKMIVKDTLSKLNNKSSFHFDGLVGITPQIQKIKELLDEARIVGIWGMGGIGKTTLAEAIFDRLNAQFEASLFVENVREKLERIGRDELRERCLKELLKDEDMNTYNFRSTFVKNRLQRKKILLVLDDVDNCVAVDDLIIACGWFGEGSRIIITSRDKQVLKNTSGSKTHHVQKLELSHALHLFSWKAFEQNEPSKSYLELSMQAMHYCNGNPLALKVLGCFLRGRGIDEWASAMKRLSQTIQKDIFNVLKLSFDGLDDTQKIVFLDLAFFLKEARWISMDCMRRIYGSSMLIDISVLKDRSLVSVDVCDSIKMHALLIDMGLEISRQQLISNPERPTRLWRHKDIYHLFNIDDKGIEAIRCMSIDSSKMMKSITLKRSHFWKMHNLIFFKVYKSDGRKPSNLNICEDLDYLPEELRFFIWEEYPLPYVPLHFCAKNLIELIMPNSNIRQLWDGKQHFPNLEEIDLSHSKGLIALPDLSHVPKIEYMDLHGCVNLAQIHSSTMPEKSVQLCIGNRGPMQIKVGGSIKGKSSGLMMVYNYLDLENWLFNKVTMKVFVCGKIISGVRFKHVVIPLADEEELRSRVLNLASLFPFVSRLEWLESPIEFGDDFKLSHSHMTFFPHHKLNLRSYRSRIITMNIRGRGREGREEEDDDLMREEERYSKSSTLIMDEVEEEDNDELIMEYCGSNIFTRLPNSITRWSLLTQLTLKESYIIGDADCKGIKPYIDVQLSFHDIPPSASPDYTLSSISYYFDMSKQRTHRYPHSFSFKWYTKYGLIYSNNNREYDILLALYWFGMN